MNNLIEYHESHGLIEAGGIAPAVVDQIEDFFAFAEQIKKQESDLKKMLLEEMEKGRLLSVKTDRITISYVGEAERETLDVKALRQDDPDTYDKYVKFSTVRPSIRVKVK